MAYSKKIIMLILFFSALFFVNFCYASDEQLDTIIDQIAQVTENQAISAEKLGTITDLTISQTNTLTNIKSQITGVKNTLDNISQYGQWTVENLEAVNKKLSSISTQLDTLAKSILNIEQYSEWTVQNLESINKTLGSISNAILQKQDEIKTEIQKGNELQEEQNNFLKNDDVTSSSSDLPSDSTGDITSDGFNNIFNELYNTFTKGTAKDLVIEIPFTGKSFTVNKSTVYGGADLGIVGVLINSFWYFVISYFIVQDISKKINTIKSGNIEDVQKDNIKEDML